MLNATFQVIFKHCDNLDLNLHVLNSFTNMEGVKIMLRSPFKESLLCKLDITLHTMQIFLLYNIEQKLKLSWCLKIIEKSLIQYYCERKFLGYLEKSNKYCDLTEKSNLWNLTIFLVKMFWSIFETLRFDEQIQLLEFDNYS